MPRNKRMRFTKPKKGLVDFGGVKAKTNKAERISRKRKISKPMSDVLDHTQNHLSPHNRKCIAKTENKSIRPEVLMRKSSVVAGGKDSSCHPKKTPGKKYEICMRIKN